MSAIPVCKCGRTCLSKEAYRGENRGRWYWKCALSRCGFFEWNDPGPHVYRPIVFTAPDSTTPSVQRHGPEQQRDPSALHIDDIFYPLGARKSRLSTLHRTKRNRTSETHNTTKPTIQLALYTSTDISVHASERHRYIQTLFRTVKGIVWNEQLRLWLFSADRQMYQRVWRLLYQHRATFDVNGVPLAILKYLPETTEQFYLRHHKAITTTTTIPPLPLSQQNETIIDPIDDYDLEFDLNGDDDIIDDDASDLPISWFQQEIVRGSKLWQSMNRNQRDAVRKGVKLDGSIYLHDPIGSGRSLQALAMALVYQDDWPVLIVCRASACQAWKKLIQSMVQLDRRDICLLDYVSSYGGKKVYSNSRNAIQSRLYRQRRRERIQQQQSRQGLPSTPVSTDQHQQKSSDGADEWCISLMNDGGDDSSFLGGWMEPVGTTSSNGDIIDPTTHSLNKKRKLEQLRQQQQFCITLKNDSGDTLSDNDEMDDGIYGSGPENGTYDLDASPDTTNASETIDSIDTSTTLVENDGNNKDEENYNQAIFNTAQFFIISYDKAKSRLSSLGAEKFKVAIFDDCHDIKRTMIPTYRSPLQKFVRGTKKTIMVSTLPIIPRPMETFPLLQIIKPNLFVDYKYFGQRYCDPKHLVFGWDYTGTSNQFELGYLLDRTLLVP